MSAKYLALGSALLMLAACETAPNESGTAGANGGAGGTMTNANGMQVGELAPGVADRVFFDYDQYNVDAEDQAVLARQAEWLKSNSGIKVTVEGHCDERGTREYNLALGERRASAAKRYLVSLGVDSSRISTISYGKERPAVEGADESSWAQNRRAVTVVVSQ